MAEAFGYSKIDLYESERLLGIYSKSEEHSGSFTSQTSDSLPHPSRSSPFHSSCINTRCRLHKISSFYYSTTLRPHKCEHLILKEYLLEYLGIDSLCLSRAPIIS